MTKLRFSPLLLCILFSHLVYAQKYDVKLTGAGLCLTSSHPLYESTTELFEPTFSVEDCLNKGGRLPYSEKTKKDIKSRYHIKSESSATIKPFSPYDWPHFLPSPTEHIDIAQYLLIETSEIKPTISRAGIVQTGQWQCPLTGINIYRVTDISVMHIVPLQYSHNNGGSRWSRAEKALFANDVENLLPIHTTVLNDKKDRGLSWLPSKNRCWYLKKFDHIIRKYRLTYSLDDQSIQEDLVEKCNLPDN